jgi:hypothetical protein
MAAPTAPLSDAERERVAANVSTIKQQPDLVEVFKEFHALDMLEGWRAIRYVGPLRADAVPGANVVCGADLVLGSAADVLKRKN